MTAHEPPLELPSGEQIELRHVGAGACPYGAGAHPYLTLGTERIDPLVVQAPGQRHMPSDDRGLPTGSEPVTGTRFDFLRARELGDTQLDTGYADLCRDADGRARVRVATPDGRRGVTLWLDEGYRYLMLFTGDSLPEPDRRRRGLGIEPMTCAPNALQSGEGLRILAPAASFTSAWGIAPAAVLGSPQP
jgi:aldose 1-epimerase